MATPAAPAGVVGIDNLSPETALRDGHFRDLENVDTRRGGRMPNRRPGYAGFHTGSRIHSLWGDGMFPMAMFKENGALYGLEAIGAAPLLLRDALDRGALVSYARPNDAVHWTDGNAGGVVLPDGTAADWWCEQPNGQPVLAPAAGGGLAAGRYQVAVTFRDAWGRESGSTVAAVVDIEEGQGIALSAIPQPASLDVVAIRVYRSGAHGTELHHDRDLAVGMTTATLTHGKTGRKLETQHLTPMPFGQIVASFAGRLLVARDRVLYWSQPFRHGLCDLQASYTRMPGRIVAVAPVGEGGEGAGVFVACNIEGKSGGGRTLWLGGANPADWTQRVAYPYGAVPGVQITEDASLWGLETTGPVQAWLASNGFFCIGLPGGQVVPLNQGIVAADSGDRGAAVLLERDGERRMVASLRGPVTAGLAIRDRVVATVHRNGVLLP